MGSRFACNRGGDQIYLDNCAEGVPFLEDEERLERLRVRLLGQFQGYPWLRGRDIEDLVQEVLLILVRAERREKLLVPEAFAYRVARNVAINYMLREVPRERREEAMVEEPAAANDHAAGRVDLADALQVIEAVVGAALVGYAVDRASGYPADEAARRNGLSRGVAFHNCRKAEPTFRRALGLGTLSDEEKAALLS